MLEYNRDRLYDRYLKWKAKEIYSRQIIFNLQNNPPNIQHIGMAGYPPPKFHGLAGEDPADYIRDLRQWCEAS